VLQYHSWCVYFVQTCKAKQGFGCVESDEIRVVTSMIQICNQNKLKGLNIQSDISFNMDVFNSIFLTKIPKVALDYNVDLSRYYSKGSFIVI